MTLCSQALCLTAHPLFLTLIKSNPLGKHSPQTILLSDARFLRYREKTFVPNGTLFHPRQSQIDSFLVTLLRGINPRTPPSFLGGGSKKVCRKAQGLAI